MIRALPSAINGQTGRWLISSLLLLGVAVAYGYELPRNPAGFYIDESSIAYNAHLIATTGRDEHGVLLPLFFRAFGEYKNPVYVYLLSSIYWFTGPSILIARLLSAVLIIGATAAGALLARRLSPHPAVPLFVAVSALFTPWLFELSRVVLEVAFYPLAIMLFLLAVHRAAMRSAWTWIDALAVGGAIGLILYSYSIGRLLAPLLAFGVVLFATRENAWRLARTGIVFAFSLAPLLVYQLLHPGALTARFRHLTYLRSENSWDEVAWGFAKHYVRNFDPWALLVTGDPNWHQIASIYGRELLLASCWVLAIAGALFGLFGKPEQKQRRWWVFICYGLAVSAVPASLSEDYVHMLRLAPMPIFLLVLMIPALDRLFATRPGKLRNIALSAVVVLTLGQAGLFQWRYHEEARSVRRLHLFDAQYPEKILVPALTLPSRPIRLADAPWIPGYIQAYWYATLARVPLTNFAKLAPDETPPAGALVISTEESCLRCRVLSVVEPYVLYVAGEPLPAPEPLPETAFRADLNVLAPPSRVVSGQRFSVVVAVRNQSTSIWRAGERGAERFQIALGNHWRNLEGQMLVNDDGRAPLRTSVVPGAAITMVLFVNAPNKPGDYVLEIDMVQEEVSWFALRGSSPLRLAIRVEAMRW